MKAAVAVTETQEKNVKQIAVSVRSDEGACAAVNAHFGRAPFFVMVKW
jgi:predicted Fe-Mo cluster-binding NifX family protein